MASTILSRSSGFAPTLDAVTRIVVPRPERGRGSAKRRKLGGRRAVQRGKRIGEPMKPLTKAYALARLRHQVVLFSAIAAPRMAA